MSGIRNLNTDDPVPVDAKCVECGSSGVVTSAFAERNRDELEYLSIWCESCGWGWSEPEPEL